MAFDLLTTVEYGGCSAKMPPGMLNEVLAGLPRSSDPDILVGFSTHDDAGVYRISADTALIQTTDFFPPVCSDPYDFGRIAAANALSDVYAMGGKPLTAMNIVMFPASRIPLEALKEILRGGQEKVTEAGCAMMGGHTIDDYPPKYGLAVTGVVHPDRVITNAGARPGDTLILTKPLGTGVIIAGRRLGEAQETDYLNALESMARLNRAGAEVMQEFGVRCATDITGFGLLGHAWQMADASNVTLQFSALSVPLLDGALALADLGCLPGAMFRNQEYVDANTEYAAGLEYSRKMLLCDAQTSGGLLMCVKAEKSAAAQAALREQGYPEAAVIGEVLPKAEKSLVIGR